MTTTQTTILPRLIALADMENDPAFEEIARIAEDSSVSADDIGNFLQVLDDNSWDTGDKRGPPGDALLGVMWKKRPERVGKLVHAQAVFRAAFFCAEHIGSDPCMVVREVPEISDILDELTIVEQAEVGLAILEIGKSITGEEEKTKESIQLDAIRMADDITLHSEALCEHPKAGPLVHVLSEWIHGWGGDELEFEKYCIVYSLLCDIVGKE